MPRPVTLFTGQWADLPLSALVEKARSWGLDGLELACWGDHFDVRRALTESGYCDDRRALLRSHGLEVFAISNHLVGQAVCDRIDERHQSILPAHVWGDGHPEGVRTRAAEEMKQTAKAAARLGVSVVNGFTGSSIWHLLYSFPPVLPGMIDSGYTDFARRWNPILDVFQAVGVRFALEVHPTEIAFDTASAERTLEAVGHHPAFGFNFDPSHFAYQGVDYVGFLDRFADRIFHAHVKDVWWSEQPRTSGVFGGHLPFGHRERFWEFRSLGRGRVDFEAIIRALNRIGYSGPMSIEWEDGAMAREHGVTEAARFVRGLDFPSSVAAFDAAFARQSQPSPR
ncbi:MAG: sugar phosphate isomerase/epimerase [Gemmatimonadaceae bacterium]